MYVCIPYMFVCTYICMYVHTYVVVYMYACMYVCMYVCIYYCCNTDKILTFEDSFTKCLKGSKVFMKCNESITIATEIV